MPDFVIFSRELCRLFSAFRPRGVIQVALEKVNKIANIGGS